MLAEAAFSFQPSVVRRRSSVIGKIVQAFTDD